MQSKYFSGPNSKLRPPAFARNLSSQDAEDASPFFSLRGAPFKPSFGLSGVVRQPGEEPQELVIPSNARACPERSRRGSAL